MSDHPEQIILPYISLSLGSRPLSELARASLTGLSVRQRLSMPTQCELTFVEEGDPAGQSGLADQLRPGLPVSVSIPGQAEALFEGELTAVEYAYGEGSKLEISARGYDFLHQLRRRQDVAAYTETTLVGLARQMLKAANVEREVTLKPGPGLTWPLLIQHQQTNLEFLVELAAQEGRYLWAQGNYLYLLGLAGLPGDPLPLRLGDNLHAAQLEVNIDESCSEVEAIGWAPELAAVQRKVAVKSPAGELAPGKQNNNGVSGRMKRRSLINETTRSAEQAEALAQAELDRLRQGETTFWGKTSGDARLHPGTQIVVLGVAAPVAGRYVITEATHTLEPEGGYTTEISTTPPEIRPRPRSDIATVGKVADVSDPQALGRVRVKLPAYDNVQTGWIPVVFPGGGPQKGFVSLPAANDSVLVLLLRENPAEGVVLGGLYGADKPPNSDILLGAAKRYTWTTAAGQKIQLNESGDLVRLETSAGAAIELNGSQIVIQGKKIDFRKL